VRIRRQQLRGGGQVSSEVLLEPGQDRSSCPDGKLLAGDLEDQRSEGIEPGELVDPGARAEVGMRVDHPPEDRVRVPEELARNRIGDRRRRHSLSSRSVSTISMISVTVSSRAQSRWSSTARATS
jgi:hypothetical protein